MAFRVQPFGLHLQPLDGRIDVADGAVGKLPALTDGLVKALAKARALGLIDDEEKAEA